MPTTKRVCREETLPILVRTTITFQHRRNTNTLYFLSIRVSISYKVRVLGAQTLTHLGVKTLRDLGLEN